ncbi:NarK family nitrate/nitrite MFS transporter [Zophobihabitans entericus]|uniref:Nitrate/nitrite transporter n=1 Tax=Zophobihabitans entericus TaxID=1635327 RepID=A0A6G9IBS9_9GAMM|nr:NarK family nitrate/nitrite MFS transporter [Zophobihabitans entericus]QIQ21688.1 NarK family nitrate/nitrite MFS transporter [Zophobihabitans entericus]
MSQPLPRSSVIKDWQPDNPEFWEQKGKAIARRNLWISIPSLMFAFSVWMLFSIVAVYLNNVGFQFTTNQLFLLTALPSISGALLRVPYSFVIPIFGGRRWTTFSTLLLIIPCIWLGVAIQDTSTSYTTFVIISLLCGFGGANFASSMANISFFFPKSAQGSALGLNGGLGNMGVSVAQFLASIVIFVPMLIGSAKYLSDGSAIWIQNVAFVWVPLLLICSFAAFVGMNDLVTAKASFWQQAVVLKNKTMWLQSLLYLATFGSFIGFSAGFAMLSKTQFPQVDITSFAFFGPLIGAIGRPLGGAISDRVGGVKATFVNYIMMIIFVMLLFTTLPGVLSDSGSFIGFFGVFIFLFFTAGFGSGSTFQMISIVFRQEMIEKMIKKGHTEEEANRGAATETAAALGFISAIGAIGGFFIPQVFSLSLNLLDSVSYALGIFLVFYVFCAIVTKVCYGHHSK